MIHCRPHSFILNGPIIVPLMVYYSEHSIHGDLAASCFSVNLSMQPEVIVLMLECHWKHTSESLLVLIAQWIDLLACCLHSTGKSIKELFVQSLLCDHFSDTGNSCVEFIMCMSRIKF